MIIPEAHVGLVVGWMGCVRGVNQSSLLLHAVPQISFHYVGTSISHRLHRFRCVFDTCEFRVPSDSQLTFTGLQTTVLYKLRSKQ